MCVYTHNLHLYDGLYGRTLTYLKIGDSMKLVDLTHLVARDFKQASTPSQSVATPQPVKAGGGGNCCSSCSGK